MTIIIISSDSNEKENEITEKCAEALGYQKMDRQILKKVSQKHNINEGKLNDALDKGPSFFRGMPAKQWHYYIACIKSEVLNRLLADNIVCCGMATQLYVNGVSHALKVRVLSGNEQKIEQIAEDRGISLKQGRKWLLSEMRRRERWSLMAFDRNENDPSLYDLVINLAQIEPAEAVQTISDAVGYRKFKPMTYSINCLKDFALGADVKSELLKTFADIKVMARDGNVKITSKALKREWKKKAAKIKEIASRIEGVNSVEVRIIKDIFGDAAESYR